MWIPATEMGRPSTVTSSTMAARRIRSAFKQAQVQDTTGLNRELGSHQDGDPHAAGLGLLPARQGLDAPVQGADAVDVERPVAVSHAGLGDPPVVGVGLGLDAAPLTD